MIYTDFQGKALSMLGFGTMRLPVINGDDALIDEAETKKMVDFAIKNGINYFDTAWGYHCGNSETVIGKILSEYPRDSFYLASKFPGYDLGNIDKVEEIFEAQLKKCRVNYFDFYLIHNVCEMNIDAYLDRSHGIFDYLMKQKENGRIKHLGFSAHGSIEVMKRFLAEYGFAMEFCQIQLNYLDWSFQNAKGKVDLLNSVKLPIWVMEPLRGGRLAHLNETETARLSALRANEGIPCWAFRFLQSIDNVKVILSGMSDFSQLEDNLHTFEEDLPLSENEMATLLDIAEQALKKKTLPCTGCHYCVSHCPNGLNIPELLALYNEDYFSDGGFLAPMALSCMPKEKQPSACLGCRSCEAVCPQNIKISEVMTDFVKRMG